MQIIKKIIYFLLLLLLLVIAFKFYKYSELKRDKYQEWGKEIFKEELIFELKNKKLNNCIYKKKYKEIIKEEEFKKICVKN